MKKPNKNLDLTDLHIGLIKLKWTVAEVYVVVNSVNPSPCQLSVNSHKSLTPFPGA